LAAIHDEEAGRTTTAERLFLYHLGGGCSAPIGAWAKISDDQVELRGCIVSVDGRQRFETQVTGSDVAHLAKEAANSLIEQGALLLLQAGGQNSKQPLHGKRVVITRPLAQGAEFAQELERQGASPLKIPAIEVASVVDASSLQSLSDNLAGYDWILFTSANAVDHFWALAGVAANQLGQAKTKVAAVGPATQAALQKRGVAVDAMPEQFEGIQIIAVLGDLNGKRILVPRSVHSADDLPSQLTRMGAQVDLISLYEPVAATIGEAARKTLTEGVDIVTFASGSAVRAFNAALRGDPRFDEFWSKVVVACIGPSTAEVASAEGLTVHVIATEHTGAGLVAALVDYYQKGL